MIDEKLTAKYKSKKFAVRIVKLYKYLCNEKVSLFYQSNYFAQAQASVQTLPKANVQSLKKTFSLKCISHLKNVPKQSTG